MQIKQLIKKLATIILSFFFLPISYLIRKKKVIILQSCSRQLYCDNTRYLYEFLSEYMTDVDVYWVTDNSKIKKYIENQGWKYISWHSPVRMIIVALQAKIVVDNGDTFFNIFNITSTRAVVKITLQHGCGPKITLHDSENIKVSFDQINKIGKFNYVNFPAKYSAYRMGRNMYFLPDYKIMKVGYPRCDSFYKTDIVNKCFREKTIAQELCSSFTDQDKIILYTPTWRPYPYSSVPLSLMNDLDMYEFDSWLRNNNLFLFCTAHPKSDQEGWMTELSRVVFIDKTLHPLFDINKFMMEVDILLNDYSTTSTDFSILKRPQLFYMPDYEFYSSKKGFFEEYRGVLPGREVFSYGEFKDTLKTILKDEDTYLLEFNNVRKKLLQRYYDKKEGKGCEELSNIITDILIDC